MGAELYLDSIFEPFVASHKSDGDPPDWPSSRWEASGGYFHNAYNAHDVMWAMGLSSSALVIPMLDEIGFCRSHARAIWWR